VERYAAHSGVPGFADLLKRGASATGDGMLTQAPPNTGAGWYTMATGAWPGVHGSTNNTFHINSQPFTPNRTTAFDAGVLSAETIAQAAERGGKRVIQMEWAGRRNGVIAGPTVDFRTFLSGRGVTTNFVSPSDRPALIAAFGLQYDPADPALTVPFTDHPVPTATGWTNVPASFSPALETHMAVLDFGVDKYGQDAYIYDSTNDGAVNYDGVLFSRGKNGSNQVADLAKGALADVKVTIQGGALNGRTGGMLVKVEGSPPTHRAFGCSTPRSPEPTPPGRDGRASPGSPATSPNSSRSGSRHRRPATSPCSKPASSARRPTSSRACTGKRLITHCSST
jgi:Type I phosphodiesterase / nucleotide pyrophosphatase